MGDVGGERRVGGGDGDSYVVDNDHPWLHDVNRVCLSLDITATGWRLLTTLTSHNLKIHMCIENYVVKIIISQILGLNFQIIARLA